MIIKVFVAGLYSPEFKVKVESKLGKNQFSGHRAVTIVRAEDY